MELCRNFPNIKIGKFPKFQNFQKKVEPILAGRFLLSTAWWPPLHYRRGGTTSIDNEPHSPKILASLRVVIARTTGSFNHSWILKHISIIKIEKFQKVRIYEKVELIPADRLLCRPHGGLPSIIGRAALPAQTLNHISPKSSPRYGLSQRERWEDWITVELQNIPNIKIGKFQNVLISIRVGLLLADRTLFRSHGGFPSVIGEAALPALTLNHILPKSWPR